MTSSKSEFFRKRRICYWDYNKRSISSSKMSFEKHLKFLPEIEFAFLKSIDDPLFFPCDLLFINAEGLEEEPFQIWMNSFKTRFKHQGKIWVPIIFISPINFSTLTDWLHEHADDNWYFDIIKPDETQSLPIRIANLLRIHDHLHELKRYHEQLITMQKQVTEIEGRLNKMEKS